MHQLISWNHCCTPRFIYELLLINQIWIICTRCSFIVDELLDHFVLVLYAMLVIGCLRCSHHYLTAAWVASILTLGDIVHIGLDTGVTAYWLFSSNLAILLLRHVMCNWVHIVIGVLILVGYLNISILVNAGEHAILESWLDEIANVFADLHLE